MDYALGLLQDALDQELRAYEVAKQATSGNGFYLKNTTMKAFEKSRQLAEERIPQLEVAIKKLTITDNDKKLLADLYSKLWTQAYYDADSKEIKEFAKPLADIMTELNKTLKFRE